MDSQPDAAAVYRLYYSTGTLLYVGGFTRETIRRWAKDYIDRQIAAGRR